MPIVVGYIPSPAGHAALTTAIAEARLRGSRLVVVNASRGDALVDTGATPRPRTGSRCGTSSVSPGSSTRSLQQVEAKDPADQILEVAQWYLRRADRRGPAPAHTGGQAHHGQPGPADPPSTRTAPCWRWKADPS